MITINAAGFIPAKPELQLVGPKRQHKCEFTVVAQRRHFVKGELETVWERAVFVAWDEEADRIASTLDKGMDVHCTGTQETSKWTDGGGQQRQTVRFKLLSWQVLRRSRGADAGDDDRQSSSRRTGGEASHREDEEGTGAQTPGAPNYLPM